MGSVGTIKLQAVWDMLDRCAPGHTRDAKTHHWLICAGAAVALGLR